MYTDLVRYLVKSIRKILVEFSSRAVASKFSSNLFFSWIDTLVVLSVVKTK